MESTWTLARGYWDETPVILRIISPQPADIHTKFPILTAAVWTFREKDERGFPTSDESDSLEVFEETLVAQLESTGKGLLVAVLTHMGTRDFLVYGQPGADIESLVQSAAMVPGREVQTNTERDYGWESYESLYSTMRKPD